MTLLETRQNDSRT